MKINLFKLSILVVFLTVYASCDQKGSKNEGVNSTLVFALLNNRTTAEQNACSIAAAQLNVCVAPGSGYDLNIMCGKGGTNGQTVQQAGVAGYTKLQSCIQETIARTSCNLTTNRAANARASKTAWFTTPPTPEGNCDTATLALVRADYP